MNDPGWWTVRVFCGHELQIQAEMALAGFEPYCPTWTQQRRNRYGRKGEMIAVTRPLFPSYLFMRPDPSYRPQLFETSRTSIAVLRGTCGRLVVSERQMAIVREAAAEASRLPPEHRIRPDDFVILLRGVLRGETAQVLRVRGRKALVALTQRATRTNIVVNLADIEGAGLAT